MSSSLKPTDGRYGAWAGNPKGNAENKANCVAEVYSSHSWIPYQCQKKRGYGPNKEYCKQHAKKLEAKKP